LEGNAMNRNVVLGTGAVVVIAAGSLVVGGAASASGSPHTLHVTATVLKHINTSKTTFVETDTLTHRGKKVGFESQSCNDASQGVKCSVTFALKNGVLLGHSTSPITSTSTGTVAGAITGGLGKYTGDKGRLKATIDGIHADFTIVYHS
jgi:hypothetical protein